MILAAIDIGSNAIRLQITRIIHPKGEKPVYKILESIRFPLRLGKDAFRTGEITFRSEIKFINLMMAFRTLIDLYEADDAFGCATSALRDSMNGQRIIDRAYEKSGLHIEMISGEREAEILDMAVNKEIDEGHYMHIDVGGGSTEINMIKHKRSYARKSFKLGSVRNMQKREKTSTWEAMINWIKENKVEAFDGSVATGGNVRTIQKLINSSSKEANIEEIEELNNRCSPLSVKKRIEIFGLREDRADVMPFASEIYIKAITSAGISKVLVPDVGLKDGIIEMLYTRNA
ncbi:MAG: phosphatase [Bacteroidota bacterium]